MYNKNENDKCALHAVARNEDQPEEMNEEAKQERSSTKNEFLPQWDMLVQNRGRSPTKKEEQSNKEQKT